MPKFINEVSRPQKSQHILLYVATDCLSLLVVPSDIHALWLLRIYIRKEHDSIHTIHNGAEISMEQKWDVIYSEVESTCKYSNRVIT